MSALKDIHAVLNQHGFFDFLININIEHVFADREKLSFDQQWMQAYSIVELKHNELSEEADAEINIIRELAFKKSYSICKNSELSAYISDDFDLICRTILIGRDDLWSITNLYSAYLHHTFPCK